MIIIGPVAVASNGIIGGDNDLPWYLPEDLKHFRKITEGKTVLMGRRTYDSIFKRLGKPLPNRKNVIITRNTDVQYPEGVLVFHNIQDAFSALKGEDVYVIGGAQIFDLSLKSGEYMYLTHVKKEYPGDVYFPEVDWSLWEKVTEEDFPEYTFAEYRKK